MPTITITKITIQAECPSCGVTVPFTYVPDTGNREWIKLYHDSQYPEVVEGCTGVYFEADILVNIDALTTNQPPVNT